MASGGDEPVQSTIHSDETEAISCGVEGSTLRVDGVDISAGMTSDSTIRDNASTINSGIKNLTFFHDISKDNIVLNDIHYDYEKTISKASGEAEIHLLTRNGMPYVFKLYYPNFKPKTDILNELKSLQHPDIINVIDFGYFNERFFELMEYAEGGTLENYLPIRDVDEIKSIVDETINALNYCHTRNIIHKDIKPANIYFKHSDGTDILIGDFGISSILDQGMTRQLTSQNLTVGYAAPEMYGLGGKVYVGREVDYYALGVSVIHVWLGKSPFEGLGIHAIANLTTTGKIPVPEDMPDELRKLVRGLLTIDYTKRWGYDQITSWLKGIDVPVEDAYEPQPIVQYKFAIAGRQSISVRSLVELTKVMQMNPEFGKKNLYRGHIGNWVQTFNSEMAAQLKELVEDEYVDDQQAGFLKAIYLLNEDEPFIGAKGARCFTARDLARELREYKAHYEHSFSGQWYDAINHPLFLYLEVRGSKEQAEFFRKFLTNKSPMLVDIYIMLLEGKTTEEINDFITRAKTESHEADVNDYPVDDGLYDEAIALVAESQQASISMVQRKLRIPYSTAAVIIERMESEGIIGPSDGTSKPREVYIRRIGDDPNRKFEQSMSTLQKKAQQMSRPRSSATPKVIFVVIILLIGWYVFSTNNSPKSTNTSQVLTIKTSANLRSGPSKDSSVVASVNEGETVEFITRDGNWYKVKYNNSEGYIHKNLLK